MTEVKDCIYIIVGNDGFPRFADPECTTLHVAKSFEAALDTAKDMVSKSPYVVFGIYALEASVFNNGKDAVVVPADGHKD
jgi:hypothetical protein